MGTPHRITFVNAVDVRRPPEVVWPYLVEERHLERWMREAIDVRIEGGRFEAVGDEGTATVRIAGITTRDRVRIARLEPPIALVIEHLGWVRGLASMHLAATDRGTHLVWREDLEPPWGIAGRIGMRAVGPLMRRTFRGDLEVLRRLVESET